MVDPVLQSSPPFFRPEPRFSNLLLLSIGLHVGLAILFSGVPMSRPVEEHAPVYYVDLSQLPVANPQAGQTKETIPAASDDSAAAQKRLQQTLERMRRDQEQAAVADRIAGLAGTGRSDAPLGMPDGTGDQVGVSQTLWLQEFLKANWTLGRYQVLRRDLETQVRVSYDGHGRLLNYQFLDQSGDAIFDESVRRAILKSRELPFQPGQRLDVPVIFNLKDLVE